jgi:iron only hydrogenase large subunit-like protein
MACPGGCIGGGGQPRSSDKQILGKRQAAMYDLDERSTLRRSHDNPFIQQLYARWLGEPLHGKAHDLLHTHYVAGGVEGGEK